MARIAPHGIESIALVIGSRPFAASLVDCNTLHTWVKDKDESRQVGGVLTLLVREGGLGKGLVAGCIKMICVFNMY